MFLSRVLLIVSLLCSLASAAPETKPAAPKARPVFEWVDGVKQTPDYRFKITTDTISLH
jgi:hypothetical protein